MNLSPADIKTLGLVLDELDELIIDVGPCEHPVNVCVCGLKSMRDDAADLFYRLSNDLARPSAPTIRTPFLPVTT